MTVQTTTTCTVENERVFGESSGHDDGHESGTSLNTRHMDGIFHGVQHIEHR